MQRSVLLLVHTSMRSCRSSPGYSGQYTNVIRWKSRLRCSGMRRHIIWYTGTNVSENLLPLHSTVKMEAFSSSEMRLPGVIFQKTAAAMRASHSMEFSFIQLTFKIVQTPKDLSRNFDGFKIHLPAL
jgi:hypothetical protein